MLTFGSLFAGVGGFDLALERAGMACRWQVEIDRDCQRVLAHHWPEVARFDDVTACRELPAVDVLCGGFPCQDVSVAGRRAGLAGARSGLFYELARIIDACRPTWVVLENVPGLLSSNRGRDMSAVLGTLGELGYGFAYRVLDAQYWGVAQRRRRVFIVGHSRAECAAQVLFEPESGNGHPAPRREAGQDAPADPESRTGTFDTRFIEAVAGTLGAHHGNVRADQAWTGQPVAHALCRPTAKGGDPSTDTYVTAFHATQDPITSAECGAALGARANIGIAHTLRPAGCDASEDGTGRGTPLVVDTTQITSPGNVSNPQPGDACHPLAAGAHPPLLVKPSVRRLTPTECERLQGFPDHWTAIEMSDSARYRMLGNAVAVPVVEWIGRRIVAVTEAAS